METAAAVSSRDSREGRRALPAGQSQAWRQAPQPRLKASVQPRRAAAFGAWCVRSQEPLPGRGDLSCVMRRTPPTPSDQWNPGAKVLIYSCMHRLNEGLLHTVTCQALRWSWSPGSSQFAGEDGGRPTVLGSPERRGFLESWIFSAKIGEVPDKLEHVGLPSQI